MTDSPSRGSDRRKALQEIAGAGAIAGMIPLLGRFLDEQPSMSLFPAAYAQGLNTGVAMGQGDVVLVPGAKTAAVAMAEWEPPKGENTAETGGLRIAQGDAAVAKAPATASRYTAKSFDFAGGSLRLLTWPKGAPMMHQITFETEIMVLEGSVTLSPAPGVAGPTATLHKGDALFMPAGVLKNLKPTSDTILLQAFVGSSKAKPKRTIVLAKNAKEEPGPKGAAHYTVKRYEFDGNSIRVAKLTKGGTTNEARAARSDVIIYVTKGRLRRHEGSQTFEAVPGDAVRETHNAPGTWEILENSEFIATDAPLLPSLYSPDMVATGGGTKLFTFQNDDNGRSHLGYTAIGMKKVSDTESLSEKQPGLVWRLGPRPQVNAYARTSKHYTSNQGPYEQHTGGPPHFTGCMAGHVETTLQDGGVLRRAAGEFCYITPGTLHHSNFHSLVPAVYFNLYVPGTDMDTANPVFK